MRFLKVIFLLLVSAMLAGCLKYRVSVNFSYVSSGADETSETKANATGAFNGRIKFNTSKQKEMEQFLETLKITVETKK